VVDAFSVDRPSGTFEFRGGCGLKDG
jgi:hypothetical protein